MFVTKLARQLGRNSVHPGTGVPRGLSRQTLHLHSSQDRCRVHRARTVSLGSLQTARFLAGWTPPRSVWKARTVNKQLGLRKALRHALEDTSAQRAYQRRFRRHPDTTCPGQDQSLRFPARLARTAQPSRPWNALIAQQVTLALLMGLSIRRHAQLARIVRGMTASAACFARPALGRVGLVSRTARSASLVLQASFAAWLE
mmetsp:Transcript_18219/g.43896  ORF Transcript_18219/g.43896 Transcript_18219/m.43896 type:complete len:201 (+) Transcript_18219:328-930(+)